MAAHLFDSPPVPASQSAIDRDPDLRIRPARPDDASAILQLETQFPGDRMSARSVRRFLTVRSAHVWVAEQAGVVVGNLIWLSRRGSRVARIYSLVVAPAARGFGLAERLIRAAETEAAALQLIVISLEVRVDNAAARRLYDKLDYAESAQLPGFYEDGGDGLKLTKALPSMVLAG